jgi:hypothetical protein
MNKSAQDNVFSSTEDPVGFAREYEKFWIDVEDIETVEEEAK